MLSIQPSPLITKEQIQKRTTEIAQDLNKQFQQETVMVIGVLKSSFVFYTDLVRLLKCKVICDFCATSSYGKRTVPSAEVRLTLDTCLDVVGKHVLLIEDIVDRGLTLNFLQSLFKSRNPQSLTTVTLLMKPHKKPTSCQVDHVGFKVDSSSFVVGYGMDYQEQFRSLPHISAIKNFN